MLVWLNKIIQEFRLRYLLYIVLLNFFFSTSLTAINYKSESQSNPSDLSTISVAENYSIANVLNLKKVERHNFGASVEYKNLHYSKYFFIDSKFLPQRISVLYAIDILDIITQYELLHNHLDFRSPPSLKA